MMEFLGNILFIGAFALVIAVLITFSWMSAFVEAGRMIQEERRSEQAVK